mmetsp:Transcript_5215/g.20741  ORF Transcript_5215/g.20741 Transcript_5215/m.20741 type:complete len:577 (-) Transcript_5215:81-1811(-)
MGRDAVVHDGLREPASALAEPVQEADRRHHGVSNAEAPALVHRLPRIVVRDGGDGQLPGLEHVVVDGAFLVVSVHDAEERKDDRNRAVDARAVKAAVDEITEDLGQDEGRDNASSRGDVENTQADVAPARLDDLQADVVDQHAEDADAQRGVVPRVRHLEGLLHDDEAHEEQHDADADAINDFEKHRIQPGVEQDEVGDGVDDRVSGPGADGLVPSVADVHRRGQRGPEEGANGASQPVHNHGLLQVVVVALGGGGLDVLHGLDEALDGDGEDDGDEVLDVLEAAERLAGQQPVLAGVGVPRVLHIVGHVLGRGVGLAGAEPLEDRADAEDEHGGGAGLVDALPSVGEEAGHGERERHEADDGLAAHVDEGIQREIHEAHGRDGRVQRRLDRVPPDEVADPEARALEQPREEGGGGRAAPDLLGELVGVLLVRVAEGQGQHDAEGHDEAGRRVDAVGQRRDVGALLVASELAGHPRVVQVAEDDGEGGPRRDALEHDLLHLLGLVGVHAHDERDGEGHGGQDAKQRREVVEEQRSEGVHIRAHKPLVVRIHLLQQRHLAVADHDRLALRGTHPSSA